MVILQKILLGAVVFGVAVGGGVYAFTRTKPFGKLPDGERLARIEKSPNYENGTFKNLSDTEVNTNPKKQMELIARFLFDKVENLIPSSPLPSVKTDLKNLPKDKDFYVWFGHSSYLLQIGGKRFLVDPVLVSGSPVSFVNKMFPGANVYSPADMPDVDYLIITHDHWDHLDYDAVTALMPKVGRVVTSLGVGAHLEYWGYPKEKITELDWQEKLSDSGVTVTALPARHFSGRGLTRNKTLWSSFMVQTGGKNVYIGGDSGYDEFYKEIAKQFPSIDLAMMENGQYNADWANIHALPEQLVEEVKILKPKQFITVHNSKFALARHPWKEPMEKIYVASEKETLPLRTPMIGEVFYFSEEGQTFGKWWEKVK